MKKSLLTWTRKSDTDFNQNSNNPKSASSASGENTNSNEAEKPIQEELHPDEQFIDYLEWDEKDAPKLTEETNPSLQKISLSFQLEGEVFDDHFVVSASHEATEETLTDQYEPDHGFKKDWLDNVSDSKYLKNINIQNTFDTNGNTYLHYAAAFGSAPLLQKFKEGEWFLNKTNYYGKIKDEKSYLGGALKYAYLYNQDNKTFLKL